MPTMDMRLTKEENTKPQRKAELKKKHALNNQKVKSVSFLNQDTFCDCSDWQAKIYDWVEKGS